MNGKIQLGIYGIHDISDGKTPLLIHDHSIAVYSNGSLLHYIHLERYTRKKYDASLDLYIERIIRDLGLAGRSDIELCFADHEIGRAFISSEGKIRFEGSNEKTLTSHIHKGKAFWFGSSIPAYWISHELAHLYSCVPFFGKFKDNSLLIHYDGGASVSNFSAWVYQRSQLNPIAHHYKLKWLTNLFNANPLVFKLTGTPPKYHNSVPGKFMGLASFGSYKPEIEKWLARNDYFSNDWSSPSSFLSKLDEDWNIKVDFVDNHHSFMQDIAATLHEIFIRESLKEIQNLQKATDCKTLYFTGGCALSIKLNSAIRDAGIFEKIFIPPCTNDSGLSIGAAVALCMKNGHGIQKESPFIGAWHKEELSVRYSDMDLEKIASLLYDGNVVGICNGKSETGPRALGNRSILARADSKKLAEKISRKIKGREWYRPVAPVMLAEYAGYFTNISDFSGPARDMLFDFEVLPQRKKEIRGAVHADGTSRIQVLSKREENPFLHDLLARCAKEYGLKALINTSFNRKDEPIVQSSEQAIQSAKEMKLDNLVINGKLINY